MLYLSVSLLCCDQVSDQVDRARSSRLRAVHAQVGRLVVRHRALRDHHQRRRALRWHEQLGDHRIRRTPALLTFTITIDSRISYIARKPNFLAILRVKDF